MAVNPDPKPGRWILPLVILAMIAFTYFFVRELPGATTSTTAVSGDTTTTTPGGDGSTTTTLAGPVDPAVQAYVDEVRAISTDLTAQGDELEATNAGFDADPREIQYPDAVSRFEAVISATQALLGRMEGLTAPDGLDANHQALVTELTAAVGAAEDALAGLQSDDPGVIRRSAVEAFGNSVTGFAEEVTVLEQAAGVATP